MENKPPHFLLYRVPHCFRSRCRSIGKHGRELYSDSGDESGSGLHPRNASEFLFPFRAQFFTQGPFAQLEFQIPLTGVVAGLGPITTNFTVNGQWKFDENTHKVTEGGRHDGGASSDKYPLSLL